MNAERAEKDFKCPPSYTELLKSDKVIDKIEFKKGYTAGMDTEMYIRIRDIARIRKDMYTYLISKGLEDHLADILNIIDGR